MAFFNDASRKLKKTFVKLSDTLNDIFILISKDNNVNGSMNDNKSDW